MDFNLPDIDTVTLADEGIRVPLTKLDGETPLLNAKGEPVGLILHGSDSAAYRTATRKVAKARVERASKAKGKVTDEQIAAGDEDEFDILVGCTAGWFGILDSGKKDVPFSAEACRLFYKRYPVAKEQADRAIMERARFTKASSGA